MKNANIKKRINRIRRHIRVRAKISGTAERPRISVFKSNRHLFVQAIDDTLGRTIISSKVVSSVKSKLKGTKTELATKIGTIVGEKMKTQGITKAVFDKSGFKYHGRIKAAAEALREAGITI